MASLQRICRSLKPHCGESRRDGKKPGLRWLFSARRTPYDEASTTCRTEQAHEIVHYALEGGGTDALYTDSNITAHFSESKFETALDPSHYLGESVEIARLSAILAEGIATRLKKARAKWRVKYLNTELCLLLGIPVANI